MFRYIETQAIVLKSYPVGEIHKGLTLLTADRGIISVIAHGAKKPANKYRGLTEVFQLARYKLYLEPVKRNYKLIDLKPGSFFTEISQNLSRYYAACLCAEIMLSSYGGGDHSAAFFELLRQSLDALNTKNPRDIVYVIIQFIWHFLIVAGYAPTFSHCSVCDMPLAPADTFYINPRNITVYCAPCRKDQAVPLNLGIVRYLEHTRNRHFSECLGIQLDSSAAGMLKSLFYSYIQHVMEKELKTLKTCAGLI